MKARFRFIAIWRSLRGVTGYYVYRVWPRRTKRAPTLLGGCSKDPLRPVWTNNHEPRTYPTRLAAAKGLL